MKKQEKIVLIFCAVLFIAGIFLGHYYGGLLTGAGGFGLLVMSIGRWQVNQLKKKVDKQMKDFVLNSKK